MKNKKSIIYIIIAILVLVMITVGVIVFKNKNENTGGEVFKATTKIENQDLMVYQSKIDEEIKKKFNDGDYTLDNPLIIVNPYEISPLSALVMFNSKDETSVKLTIKGKDNDEDITHEFEKSKIHYIPVYGLYANDENNIELKVNNKTKKLKIKTEVENIEKVDVVTKEENKLNDDLYFLSSPNAPQLSAYDKSGNVRWYIASNMYMDIELLKNGNLLVSSDQMGSVPYSKSGLFEIDMLGKVHNQYDLQGGYHHDVDELDDGNLLVGSSNPTSDRTSDYIVVLDRKTGKNIKTFDLYEIISKIDSEYAKDLSTMWAWNNSLDYDKKNNSIIASLRNRNSVLSINYDTGELNYIISDPKNWSEKFSKYLFKQVKEFKWPMGQHSASVLDDGSIAIFNNGYDALNETDVACKDLLNNYSSPQIFTIDTNNMTIDEKWSYNLGHERFSYALSNFYVLDNGNMLLNSGWTFDEVDQNSSECTQFGVSSLKSSIMEFDKDGKPIFEMNIKSGKYRVKKLHLYNNNKNANLDKSNIYRNIVATPYEKVDNFDLNKEYETYEVSIEQVNDRLKYVGLLPDDFEINYILVNDNGIGQKYNLKKKNEKASAFIYLNENMEKSLLFVEVNGTIYKTGKYIELEK